MLNGRKRWVFTETGADLLTDWSQLNNYPVNSTLYDPSDKEATWGFIRKGITCHLWQTIEVEHVPSQYRAMALLLT